MITTTNPSARAGEAHHEWLFAETPEGVRVSTTESFSGDPVNADGDAMQNLFDSSLVAWLAHMKAKAEES